jgi:hypothetical protein
MCKPKIDPQDKSKVTELFERLLEELDKSSKIIRQVSSIVENVINAPRTNDTPILNDQLIIMMEQLNSIHKKTTDISTFWPQLADKDGHNIMLRLHSRLNNMFVCEINDMRMWLQIKESSINNINHSPKTFKRSKDILARSVYNYAKGMIKLANYYQIARTGNQPNIQN